MADERKAYETAMAYRKVQEAAYKDLAVAVIKSAFDELREEVKSQSASKFFGSDWFMYLCLVAEVDGRPIRRAAYRLPGFMSMAERRDLKKTSQPYAVALGKKRKHRASRVKLIATPPDGKPFEINGYVNAAKLLGCTPAAVKIATDRGRPCLGWIFVRR